MLKFQVDHVSPDTCNKIWMCLNCAIILKTGKVPGQAKNINLALRPIPKELSCLNSMEIMLLSRCIPFMKLVSLPKGKQIANHGLVVNVPTNRDCFQYLTVLTIIEDGWKKNNLK